MTESEVSGDERQAPEPGRRFHRSPQVPPPVTHRPRRRLDGWAMVILVLVALAVAYVSLSDSSSYLHIGHNGCVITHFGWHFHFNCGSGAGLP